MKAKSTGRHSSVGGVQWEKKNRKLKSSSWDPWVSVCGSWRKFRDSLGSIGDEKTWFSQVASVREDHLRDPWGRLPCCSWKIRRERSKSGWGRLLDASRGKGDFSAGKIRIAGFPLINGHWKLWWARALSGSSIWSVVREYWKFEFHVH